MKVRLGDVCEKKIDILNAAYTGNIEYIDISSIDNQKKKITQTHRIPVENAPSRAKQLVNVGDILVSTVRPNLNAVALIGQRAGTENVLVASTGYCVLRCLPQAYSNYVFYFCQSPTFIENISSQASGASYPAVTSAIVKNCLIPLPSLEEQRHIAAVLDKVSELISKRKAQLDKLDELVKSRFVEMFGDENSMQKWGCCKISEISEVFVGVVIKPAQYYTTDKEQGVPAFRSLNIGEMYIKDEDWVYFTFEGNRKNSKSILQENDLAIVRSGAPGTACVITEKYSGFNAIDIIIARPDIEKINPIFMCAFTNLPHGKKQIEIGTGGAAQQHFNVSKYKEMDICLPQKELQDKFGNYVNQVNAEKQKIKRSLDQLETLKKALMQEYFG